MMRKTLALFALTALLSTPAFAAGGAAGGGAGSGSGSSGHSGGGGGGGAGVAGHGGGAGGAHAIAGIHAAGSAHVATAGFHAVTVKGSQQRQTAPTQVHQPAQGCSPLARQSRDLSLCSAPAKVAMN